MNTPIQKTIWTSFKLGNEWVDIDNKSTRGTLNKQFTVNNNLLNDCSIEYRRTTVLQ